MRLVPKYLGTRIIAVVFAFLLWIHVVTNREYEHTFTLNFAVEDVPDDMILSSKIPDKCELRVTGTGKQLFRFMIEADTVKFSAAEYSAGSYMVELSPDDLIIDHTGAAVITSVVSPENLPILIEERLEKRLPVDVAIEIVPAPGYVDTGTTIVIPDSVTVSGPKRLVRRMREIKTVDLKFDDINTSIDEHVDLAFSDSSFLTLSDSSVRIKQNIVRLQEKTFTGIPLTVTANTDHPTMRIVPDSVSVVVEALASDLDSVLLDQFSASITLDSVLPGSTFVRPEVIAPENLRVVDVLPKEILVEVPY